ncbi:T9SS type A sorting domain-containing protein [uncultured Bacteroides sp.]|uniref:T9SS type A sorting domain-containing protein n=1 Tax=uncultured Bacteroides sp. TaxID=162156 RepID=UPI002AAB4800|nr:T9SS type A sorting domain-containing protein [uncultured Bacteroides sp.]
MKKITLTLVIAAIVAFMSTNLCAQAEFNFAGSKNYYLIYLDEETSAQIPKADIKKDYRPDDVTHFLYVWENTYTNNEPTGPNSNGVPGTFIDFSVGSVGWSGFGFAGVKPGKDMTGIDDSYYFHIALKTSTAQNQVVIINGDGPSAKLNFGNTPFNDNGKIIDPYKNFARDGEWHSFDIPMSTLSKMGCKFTDTAYIGNVVSFLSGATTGSNICIDAVFFYQKKNTGISNTATEKVLIGEKSISVPETKSGITLYDVSGKLVKTSNQSIISIEDIDKGIYILKSGDLVKKIAIK